MHTIQKKHFNFFHSPFDSVVSGHISIDGNPHQLMQIWLKENLYIYVYEYTK